MTRGEPVTRGEVEDFCLNMPGSNLRATASWGRAFAVSSRTFAVLTPAGTLEFRCTAAAARLLGARPGVVPAFGPDDDAGCWMALPGGIDAIEAEELLDYLRLAYGLAVAGLPERRREPLLEALRRAPPQTWRCTAGHRRRVEPIRECLTLQG